MQQKYKRILKKTLLVLILLAITPILFKINFYFANYILKNDSVYTDKKYPIAIKKPLVFTYRTNETYGSIKNPLEFFKNKFDIDINTTLPSKHPLLVDIDWVMKANPYPPLLGEYTEAYPVPNYISFGYIDLLDNYKQITYYYGEADTTPSIFMNKVRSSSTYWGDYFVKYTFYLSKQMVKKPLMMGIIIDEKLPPKYPNIDHIEWSSYAGASSNGFEEFGLALLATLLEIIFIYWKFVRIIFSKVQNLQTVSKSIDLSHQKLRNEEKKTQNV